MIRWFKIRRLLKWTLLVTCVVVTTALSTFILRPKSRLLIPTAKATARKAYASIRNVTALFSEDSYDDHSEGVENVCVPKPFVLSNRKNWLLPLTTEHAAPFHMQQKDMERVFQEFLMAKVEKDISMEKFLWDRFRVQAVPPPEDGVMVGPLHRFVLSLRRHVALFNGEYLLRGGKATISIPLEACSVLGLGETEDEEVDERFEDLNGAQGYILIKKIPYPEKTLSFPFVVNAKGEHELLVKYFKVDLNQMGKTKEDYKLTASEAESEDSKDILTKRLSKKIFGRELNALSSIHHESVIRPVCFAKTPHPKLVLPLMQGDMIPTDDDHLAFYRMDRPVHVLTPDETFLPRFFRQLVEAVYAIHLEGFIHLDLKPENMVVHGPDRKFVIPSNHPALDQYRLVLIDFGLARLWQDLPKGTCVRTGTEAVMAPEQFMCNHDTGRPADWWAVAASMWRIRILWEPTLSHAEREALVESRDKYWGRFSTPAQPFFDPLFQDLLDTMLTPNPKDRNFSESVESMTSLLDHPYLLRGLSMHQDTGE